MANPNKARGTRWETLVVAYLNADGLDAHRTGSADVGSGDIHFAQGELSGLRDGWTAEAKDEARIDLPGYLRQLENEVSRAKRWHHKAAVWIKNRRHGVGDAYVVMPGWAYRELVVYVCGLEREVNGA